MSDETPATQTNPFAAVTTPPATDKPAVEPVKQDEEAKEASKGELELLKERATLLGVPFSNNIKIETLRERVKEKMEGKAPEPVNQVNALEPETPAVTETMSLRDELYKDAMRLIRCRITNLDPKKKDLPGEIFTVANEILGSVTKYVPYGELTDDGYHIPNWIYKRLEKRRFLHIRTSKDRRTGQTKVEHTMAKEFAIEILPDLTPEELEKLAQAQRAAGSVE